MAAFGRRDTYCQQTADLGGFMAAFGRLAPSITICWSSNCRPRRFHGRFWEISPIHKNLLVLKLPTSAVLWPLFSPVTGNCKTLAVLWPLLGGVIPTVTKPLTLAVLWPLLGYDKKWPWNASLGSFMDSVIKLQPLAVLWPLLGDERMGHKIWEPH